MNTRNKVHTELLACTKPITLDVLCKRLEARGDEVASALRSLERAGIVEYCGYESWVVVYRAAVPHETTEAA